MRVEIYQSKLNRLVCVYVWRLLNISRTTMILLGNVTKYSNEMGC